MCNSFFAQVKLFSLSFSLSHGMKCDYKKIQLQRKVFNRHACWRGSEPERDKFVFQEKFHYVHIGQNLRWIFDALPIQSPIDINRAATLSPDLQNVLQNLKPSRLFSENRLFLIFMNNFFFQFGMNRRNRPLYMHSSVNTYALKCMQISLLRTAPFISWQWVLVKICGEKLLAFFVNNYYTSLERKYFLKRFGNKYSI